MKGRKPLPSSLKVLRGTQAAPSAEDAPRAALEAPECPGFLDDGGAEEWGRIVGELRQNGTLAKTDRAAIALYCSAFSTWRRATAELARSGFTVPTKESEKTHPNVAVADKAAALMARLLVEFGLTPSARARVDVARAEIPADPLDKFLSKRKA